MLTIGTFIQINMIKVNRKAQFHFIEIKHFNIRKNLNATGLIDNLNSTFKTGSKSHK